MQGFGMLQPVVHRPVQHLQARLRMPPAASSRRRLADLPQVTNVLACPGGIDGDGGPVHGCKQVAAVAEAALPAALDGNLLHRPGACAFCLSLPLNHI